MRWDGTCGELVPNLRAASLLDADFALTAARIGVHFYLEQPKLFSDEYILDRARAGVLRGVPVRLVSGRYDLLCPPRWSDEVREALQVGGGADCAVEYVEAAGHAGSEAGIRAATQRALTGLSETASMTIN